MFVNVTNLNEWRERGDLSHYLSSNLYLTDFIEFKHTPLYRNRDVLHQKYVVEKLSIRQIAKEITSSKEAIRANLIRFGIPLREKSKPHGRPAQVPFGMRKVKGKLVAFKKELNVKEAVLEMRKQGMGLRVIARALSQLKIPTKEKGKAWHPQMVKRLLI